MKWSSILRNKTSIIFIIFALLLNALLWAFMIYRIHPQENPYYLHYNIYFGVDLVGPWYHMFFVPASGTVILIFNTFLAVFLIERDKVLHYFLLSTSFILQIILIVSTLLIIAIN